MIDLILFSIIFSCSLIASYYDIKTTEVPDKVFYFAAILSIPFLIYKLIFLAEHNFLYFGILFSIIGFAFYKLGQWGGADSFLFALIGFTFHKPIDFMINLFAFGAIYMLANAFLIARKNRKILRKFFDSAKKDKKKIFLSFSSILIFFYAIFQNFILSLSFSTFFISIFLLTKLLLIIEKTALRKRIPVSKLKVGDMLAKRRELVGITQEEIAKLKKSGKKYVWIKEGIKFIPVFPFSLIFTFLFGNVFLILSFQLFKAAIFP